MLALIIILAVLLLILCLSVGADAAYDGDGFRLKLKIGPFRKQLIPPGKKKPKPEEEEEEPKEEPEPKDARPKRDLPFRIGLEDVRELLGIVFRLLGRLRRGLSVDRLMLHLLVASEDPFDAVKTFGTLNAALAALAGPAHRALKIRDEDVQTCVDFDEESWIVEARIVLTLQIWEILYAVLCAGCAAGVWFLRKRRAEKRERKQYEQKLKAETITKGI